MEQFLQKHQIEDKTIAVGVSGGADSLALALMAAESLASSGRKIVALTVDHGLRPNSAKEAAYVAQIMQKYDIEHHILPWIGQKPQTGVEEAARAARYGLMADWCHKNNVHCIMLAHHSQDQAETFLMRLERGSGLSGLCAMREVSNFGSLLILRPLLNTSPQQLQKYLQQKNIRWIEDESNQDERFLRNKIRKFLPLLEQKIGISTKDICQTTIRLQSAEDFIQNEVKKFLATEVIFERKDICHISCPTFNALHYELQFRVLAEIFCNIYIPRANSILNLAARLKQAEFKSATLGNKEILRYKDEIWIVPKLATKGKSYRHKWQDFVGHNPQYKKQKLPFKAKFALVQTEVKGDL